MSKKKIAEALLNKHNLLERLSEIGTPTVVGSMRMDLMVSNDIDIDVENTSMTMDALYDLTSFLLQEFHPTWYEAKEVLDAEGKPVWFHGFEAVLDGELWNFDIWFFDSKTVQQAADFCGIVCHRVSSAPGAREAILRLKEQLLAKGLYSFDQYSSMDVYTAVLDHGIYDLEAFLQKFRR